MRDLTVAASAVRALMELAASKGASRKTLAERSRIARSDLQDADNRVLFSKYVALMRAGQELCDDPALALHFGEAVDGHEVSIAHMVGGAENIGDAIAQGNALRIDEALLSSYQFPTSSQYVTGVMRDHAEALLQRLESSQSTRDRVENLLTPPLPTGEVSMGVIAGTLCCSRQTLFRKLKVEWVTFEQVLDELRHKLALNYLNANKASVKETARLVGYSDPAAFSRAFKRWTGSSPRMHVSRCVSSA